MRCGWFLLMVVWLPLGFITLLVQPLSAFQPSVKNTILAGTVTFESKFGDRPAADYLISFQKTDCESCMYSARTNAQGKFRVEVPPGRYRIIAQERASTGEMKDLIPPGQLQVIEVTGFQVNCDIRLTMPAALEETLTCVKEQAESVDPSPQFISLKPIGYDKLRRKLVLELKNQSARTFSYSASRPESPIFQYQVYYSGHWQNSRIYWCYQGVDISNLNGNSVQRIMLDTLDIENGRNVKLKICITGWFSKKVYDIWTQPFKINKLPDVCHE